MSAPERRQNQSLGERLVKIEILYVLDCPNYPAAMAQLKSVLAAEKISAQIHEVLRGIRQGRGV